MINLAAEPDRGGVEVPYSGTVTDFSPTTGWSQSPED